MTVPPPKASHGLDLEYRPRHYQLRAQETGRSPCRSGLPPCLPGEAEIARLTVGTVDADCYSLRARRAGGRFQYRIVDQYFTTWLIQPRSTQRCLSLGELLQLIDGARPLGWEPSPQPLADLWRNRIALTRGGGAAAAAITVSSASYPGVEEYFQRQTERWLATTSPANPAEYAA